jgi:hypothetical protein
MVRLPGIVPTDNSAGVMVANRKTIAKPKRASIDLRRTRDTLMSDEQISLCPALLDNFNRRIVRNECYAMQQEEAPFLPKSMTTVQTQPNGGILSAQMGYSCRQTAAPRPDRRRSNNVTPTFRAGEGVKELLVE